MKEMLSLIHETGDPPIFNPRMFNMWGSTLKPKEGKEET
jgi:hypothetical protein